MLTRRTTTAGSLIGIAASIVIVSRMAFGTHSSFFYQSVMGLMVTIVVGYGSSFFMAAPPSDKIAGYVVWTTPLKKKVRKAKCMNWRKA
jgi:membrane-associated phospholipid phosphatase